MTLYFEQGWHLPPAPANPWGQWADGFTGGKADGQTLQSQQPFDDLNNGPRRVLVVDDEQLIADTLVRILNLNGFVAEAVYSGEAALDVAIAMCPEIVLTDVRMPGRNGIETGILIRHHCPNTQVVLLSGQAGIGDMMEQARNAGHPFELWSKPIHPRDLLNRLRDL